MPELTVRNPVLNDYLGATDKLVAFQQIHVALMQYNQCAKHPLARATTQEDIYDRYLQADTNTLDMIAQDLATTLANLPDKQASHLIILTLNLMTTEDGQTDAFLRVSAISPKYRMIVRDIRSLDEGIKKLELLGKWLAADGSLQGAGKAQKPYGSGTIAAASPWALEK